MFNLLTSISSTSMESSRDLVLEVVKDSAHRAKIAELKGEDAQCIADFLSVLLHEDDTFRSEGGQRLFRLLKRLVQSSEVLPQCYKLQNLQCDFSHAREGGSFADIYEGEYRKRKVCVKAVRIFEKDDNTRMLKAMAKEAVLWAHLSHINILPFYGVYLTKNGRICIISPWMNRGDLSAHMKDFPYAPRLPLIRDIIAGLQYLHESSIVHGDLKSRNVLISDQGHALIADFGISCHTARTNSVSSRVSNGSVPWMAPELFDDDRDCRPTPESDVWSFGCVCYEVFTGKAPFFDCANDYKIWSALVQRARQPGDVNQLSNVGTRERELMNRCWSYEPHSRPDCGEIYKSVVNLVGEHDQPKVQDIALWKTIRGGSGMAVNHVHAQRILLGIRGTHELSSEDIIIAVMGPTGVGKSHFIEVLTGQIGRRSEHHLESCTTEVWVTVVEDYIGSGTNLVMVDTPGFDDTNKPDTEILSVLSKWLEKTYRKNIKLTGILYLHRITDNRMGGAPLKNLRMFGKLCGDAMMSRVSLVTTMWDQVQDQQVARDRELELKVNFWKTMIDFGSKTVRFENNLESAKAIVDGMVMEKREREILLLQEELVDLRKRLNETHAGRTLYNALQKLVDEQKASKQKLMEQIQNLDNAQVLEGLQGNLRKVEEDLRSALDGVRELQVPLSRRILLFFFGKRGKIKPISES